MQNREPGFDQLSTLKHLPTLPHILLKLIKCCNRDNVSLKEISQIIEKDPSLAGKILRLVNSVYYGLPRKIESIEQAVGYLGTKAVKNVAISASVFGAFRKTGKDPDFNLGIFWHHCLRCAVIARMISKEIRYHSPDEAFLSGLLHDIGKLVLWVNFRKEYTALLKMYKDRPDLLLASEIRLAATHPEIGAWLLQRWNLQSFMADSVLYHHEPEERILEAFPLVKIVYVSNTLSKIHAGKDQQEVESAKRILDLGPPMVQAVLSKADSELNLVARSLDIEIEPPGTEVPEVSLDEDTKQAELAREVRDISLLLGTLQALLEAQDQDMVLKSIQEGIQVLFDTKDALFFLYDREKHGLMARIAAEDPRSALIRDMVVPMEAEKSLVTACLRDGEPKSSFSYPPGSTPLLLDNQIVRFLGKQGIFCLPMIARGENVGVIVLGLDRGEDAFLSKNSDLLRMFASQAALSLETERLRGQRLQMVQSERAGASSEIARRVVHEVNNPLGIIKNYLKILGLKLSDQGVAQDEIRIINEEIDRVASMVRQLNSFSGKRTAKFESVDVNDLLVDLIQITDEPLLKKAKIQVHTDLAPSLPRVETEKDGLKQVFMNLVKNAVEAMPDGGNLFVQTRFISPYSGQVRSEKGKGFQGCVEVIIRDDGPGIPEEIKARLFEPFSTSKGGEHSGLGLSIVHGIVKALKGVITCESVRGRGTSFKIELPVEQQSKG